VRMRVLRIAAAIAVCALTAVAAESRPNFSGSWKTNPEKSQFGPLPPNVLTWDIDHQDPKLTLSITYMSGGETRTVVTKYLTDGKETVNKPGAVEIKSVAHWEVREVVIESHFDAGAGAVNVRERWSVSEDLATLTMQRTITGAQGNYEQKLVYDLVRRAD
jgi:hypothetical protein